MHQDFRSYATALIIMLSLLLTACSDSGSDPDPPPEKPDINANLVAQDGSENALSGLTITSGGDTLAANADGYTATQKQGESKRFTVAKNGYESDRKAVTFDEDKTVTFTLTKEDPETAQLSYRIENDSGELAENGELFIADTLAAQGSEGSVTLPFGAEGEACGRAENSSQKCENFSLANGDDSVSLTVSRKTVTLSITPEIAEFSARTRSRGDDFITYSLTVNGTEYVNQTPTGELLQEGTAFDVEVENGTEVTISGRFIYLQERREEVFGRLERSLAVGESSVSVSGDTATELALEHQPACSDGIANIADGKAKDENASGCVADDSPTTDVDSPERVYDPDDDFESLLVYGETFNLNQKKLLLVSSKEEEDNISRGRRVGLLGNTFPEAIKFAIGSVNFYLENRIEKAQDGEESAVDLTCKTEGSNADFNTRTSYISDIIPDDPEVDGWRESLITNFTGELFAREGVECSLALQHGTLARGEEPGDGEDDIVIATDERSVTFGYEGFVEPETLPEELRSKAAARAHRELPAVRFADPLK